MNGYAMSSVEILAVVLTVIGSLFFITTLVEQPKYRIIGFIVYTSSTIPLIIYALIINSFSIIVIQIIYIIVNVYGIRTSYRTIKENRKSMM